MAISVSIATMMYWATTKVATTGWSVTNNIVVNPIVETNEVMHTGSVSDIEIGLILTIVRKSVEHIAPLSIDLLVTITITRLTSNINKIKMAD